MRYCCDLPDEASTRLLGKRIVDHLQRGAFVALRGDLGAGKTVLVKGMAEALGVKERVTSPTFTVMCQYSGTKELYHFDLYRITEEDCFSLGFDDFFYDPFVICAVEWSERLSVLPEHSLTVELVKTGELTRRAEIDDPTGLLKEFT